MGGGEREEDRGVIKGGKGGGHGNSVEQPIQHGGAAQLQVSQLSDAGAKAVYQHGRSFEVEQQAGYITVRKVLADFAVCD